MGNMKTTFNRSSPVLTEPSTIERPTPPYPSVLKVLSPNARVWADTFDNGELRAEEGGVILSGGVVRCNSNASTSAVLSLLHWAAAGGPVREVDDHPEVDVLDGCGLIQALDSSSEPL
jgi:hypothetical protein